MRLQTESWTGKNPDHGLNEDGWKAIAMRIKLKEIVFANGVVFVDLYNLSFRVQAVVNTQ